MSVSSSPALPPRFLGLFLEIVRAEVGPETLELVLAKGDLPVEFADPKQASALSASDAAERYAAVQKAMRTFYGRGARGTLIRIGRLMWPKMLETASFSDKAQAGVVRAMPLNMRRKPALELLARLIRVESGDVTIHTLDMDLMLVDRVSGAAAKMQESAPICYVTLGLIQDALYWATGHEHDIEEQACMARGGQKCEFKIKAGAR